MLAAETTSGKHGRVVDALDHAALKALFGARLACSELDGPDQILDRPG